MKKNNLSTKQQEELLSTLKERFEKNRSRHEGLDWTKLEKKIKSSDKLWSLQIMEETGGEPDVVSYDKKSDEYIFYDCSTESPKGRRSLCYDDAALKARKEHKPKDSAMAVATSMGIELLSEEQYHYLQTLGDFDTKTSSWLLTPEPIRKNGGAIFGDFRYQHTFIYHNGADSYYAARGFRGMLRI